MKIPVSWLKEFVDIDVSPEELAEKLVSCGFEIEEIIYERNQIQNVVVGKIQYLTKHPNADKLQVAKIDVGSKVVQIATSATNVKVGDLVPVALDGALVSGHEIKSGEMRGILSEGMMCGGEELGLTEDEYSGASVYGILILKDSAKIGADIHEEIGKDEVILDVSITANRADCNSVYGIAREVAAVTKKPLKPLDLSYKSVRKAPEFQGVDVKEKELCPRYMAQTVENVTITSSPETIKKRLISVGLRPINNFVDITNYVLMEIGQPMHAFDSDLLNGKRIEVRRAKQGESIIALDNKNYALSEANLVIADAEKPVAIAGVMGGLLSSVTEKTETVVFESARFARDSVRHTSRELNLRSDSSARYEKGVDFYAQEVGLKRALHFVDKFGWGTVVGCPYDTNPEPSEKIIRTTPDAINRILGIQVPVSEMTEILNCLLIETKFENGEIISRVPAFREDLVGKHDLAEEIIRIYGYGNIVPTLFQDCTLVRGGRTAKQKAEQKIKNVLIGKGMYEIVTYSFVSPKIYDLLNVPQKDALRNVIKITNPIGEDFSVMRTTLAHSMIKTMTYNFQNGNKKGKFFEVAKTYLPKSLPIKEYPEEKYKLALGAYGENTDFYSFKAIIEDLADTLGVSVRFKRAQFPFLHDTRSAEILDAESGTVVGYFGEVHPLVLGNYGMEKRMYFAEIDEEYLTEHTVTFRTFRAISKYQAVERDLAILADEATEAESVLDVIRKANSGIIESQEIFDVYSGGQVPSGKKSVAVKITLRNQSGTLTDGEVNQQIAIILKDLEEKLGATLR